MSKYIISYYLEEKNSDLHHQAIRKYIATTDNWCNFIPFSFLFETNKPLSQIKDELSKLIGKEDSFIICEITKNFIGQFNSNQSKWIKDNFI